MDGVCTTHGLLVSESAVLCGIGELLGGASEFSKAVPCPQRISGTEEERFTSNSMPEGEETNRKLGFYA